LDKKLAIEKCSEWVVQNCHPFSAVSGNGLRSLAKFFIQSGTAYGANVDVDDPLPDATTLSRNAEKDAEEKRTMISKKLKKAVDNEEYRQRLICGQISTSTDIFKVSLCII